MHLFVNYKIPSLKTDLLRNLCDIILSPEAGYSLGTEQKSCLMPLWRIWFSPSWDHPQGSLHSSIYIHVATKWFQRWPKLLHIPIQIRREGEISMIFGPPSHILLPVQSYASLTLSAWTTAVLNMEVRVDCSKMGRASQAREQQVQRL